MTPFITGYPTIEALESRMNSLGITGTIINIWAVPSNDTCTNELPFENPDSWYDYIRRGVVDHEKATKLFLLMCIQHQLLSVLADRWSVVSCA